jgi:hypothetical protein
MTYTNFKRDDGFGAQYQTIIFSILWCDLTGNDFIYTPINTMAHNYDNDPNFISQKEKLINIIYGYETIDQYKGTFIQTDSTIYNTVESNINICYESESMKKIKELFYKDKNKNYFNNDKINVAVHVRRPNPHDIGTYGYVGDDYYINLINTIRSDNIIFHVYSQGDVNEFDNFKNDDIILHLNESIEDTFISLVMADKLIMSKGSFSYCAGLLSNGDVYYLPFWHKPLNKWKIQ